jgi:hypothetical protein
MDYLLMQYVDECFERGDTRAEMLADVRWMFPGKGSVADSYWDSLQADYQQWQAVN